MRRWFLSYHSPDEVLAARLKAAVEAKDKDARIFFAPAHLRAGGFWQKALADEIAEADGFILLVGETGIGNWQELEYLAGLDRRATSQFPLVLLLLDGQTAPGLPFLRQLHWIVTKDPTSEKDIGQLIEALAGQGTTPVELWRYTSPYRGLAAMEEKDSDYFFGRAGETNDVLDALAAAPDRLPVIIGNSGVGKSSLAQAGVLAALKRQTRPEAAGRTDWPAAFAESRQWCFLILKPGSAPLKSLVQAFIDTWQFEATDPDRVDRQTGWIELLAEGNAKLADLFDATELRYKELGFSPPPAFFLYIDQGEELYVRGEKTQSRRFSEIIAAALADRRFRAIMSLRSDFLGELQKDQALFDVHRQINLPPLRLDALRQVVHRPAELLDAAFEPPQLADSIANRAAEESTKDAGALPLLSYLLDDMWTKMIEEGDGVLRLSHDAIDLGRVLVERANAFVAQNPKSEDRLRHILTLKLATVREGEDATRRRALRSEFSDEEWRLISELADHPYRLLVTVTAEAGEPYAEVAHEALFRRWDRLRNWIAAEREFLAWKSGLETARRRWELTHASRREESLLMGAALTKAESWFSKRRDDLSDDEQFFIAESIARQRKQTLWAKTTQIGAFASLVIIILGLLWIIKQDFIKAELRSLFVERPYAQREFWPHVLTAAQEQALVPGKSFRECATDCPMMVVIPAGSFNMGSPIDEIGRSADETKQHPVTIGQRFAVAEDDVTFDQWTACVKMGECPKASDGGYHGGLHPVIYVSWVDAQRYAAWLSKMTGRTYRLLSEAEWEYAARAQTTTAYYWGETIGKNNADCNGCGSPFDNREPAPIKSFKANPFGLYDMAGNVFQWVEDCYHPSYDDDAPKDGTAWTSGDCANRVARGGSWNDPPDFLRSAKRLSRAGDLRSAYFGFRVARTMAP